VEQVAQEVQVEQVALWVEQVERVEQVAVAVWLEVSVEQVALWVEQVELEVEQWARPKLAAMMGLLQLVLPLLPVLHLHKTCKQHWQRGRTAAWTPSTS